MPTVRGADADGMGILSLIAKRVSGVVEASAGLRDPDLRHGSGRRLCRRSFGSSGFGHFLALQHGGFRHIGQGGHFGLSGGFAGQPIET